MRFTGTGLANPLNLNPLKRVLKCSLEGIANHLLVGQSFAYNEAHKLETRVQAK